MSDGKAKSEFEDFLSTFSQATRRKWLRAIQYRIDERWDTDRIWAWIRSEFDEQTDSSGSRHFPTEPVRFSASEDQSLCPKAIRQGFSKPVLPQKSKQTSHNPHDHTVYMTGTDGPGSGVVLYRAHLFNPQERLPITSPRRTQGEAIEGGTVRHEQNESARDDNERLVSQQVGLASDEQSYDRYYVSEAQSFKVSKIFDATLPAWGCDKPFDGSTIGSSITNEKPAMEKLDQSNPVKAIRQDHTGGDFDEEKFEDKGYDLAGLPYWVISLACSAWLVHSMAEALGGGWSYILAIAFDVSPVLLVGAKVSEKKTHQKAMAAAILIFLSGLSLYIAPHVQTLANELSTYSDQSRTYSLDLAEYETNTANAKGLVTTAKRGFDDTEAEYKTALEKYGSGSWRTGLAKQKKDKAYAEWRLQSEKSLKLQKPVPPTYTNSLRDAAQEIIKRVGLFGIAFMLMFVLRRLET